MKDTNTINEGLDRLNLSIMYTMAFFILVFAISNIALATSQTQKSTIPLIQEEKKWLKEHPVIRVSNQINWRPFDFLEDGKPSGFSVEYLNLVTEKTGFLIEYVSGKWKDLLQGGMIKILTF